jgi:hypothetical protein
MPDTNVLLNIGTAARSLLRTVPNEGGLVQTTAANRHLLRTVPLSALVSVGGSYQTVIQIASPLDKNLVLVPSVSQVSTTSPYIVVNDDTPPKEGDANGYEPTCPGTLDLPCRAQLDLYVGYYLWTATATPQWTFVPSTDPQEDPFTQDVFNVPTGVLQVCLVGVPQGTVLTDFQKENLYWLAQSTAEWFTGEIGYVFDSDLYAQIWVLRRKFTDALMCGKCKGDNLRTVEGLLEGMIGALNVGQYDKGVTIYNGLKQFLETISGDCGC